MTGWCLVKNRLSFKQYCKDKLTKWGIKTFILTDSRNGYLYNAEVYVGKSDDSLHPELGATGNIVRSLLNGLENQGHLSVHYTVVAYYIIFIT